MAKRYDLIVAGGGPGGLMAAKTAAEDGLKVLLIERKKDLTKIHRACMQALYIHKVTGSPESEEGKTRSDGYIEPISVELFPDKCRFHFHGLGFSIDYEGSYTPYYHWIDLSPSGYYIHRHKPNDKMWAIYYDKEVFLAGLLSSATKVGAEILSGVIVIGAENTVDGVEIRVRGKSGEQTLTARNVIAADGRESNIVESLGLNKTRKIITPPTKMLHYEMDGIETNLPPFSFLWITIPSLNPFSNFGFYLKGMGINVIYASSRGNIPPSTLLEKFMNYPTFTHWFRNARIVNKTAGGATIGLRTPIREPVAGNVVIVGDAGAPVETWIQGAIACGYQAVKAIEKELDGQRGYSEYINWWQSSFAFNDPHYWKVAGVFTLNKICSDEEVDYLYSLFQGRVGCAMGLIANNLEMIKKERPELYEKLKKSYREAKIMVP
jgi:flavin-dependent dehydrogenase